jgi:hypothetical protein
VALKELVNTLEVLVVLVGKDVEPFITSLITDVPTAAILAAAAPFKLAFFKF